MHSDIFVRLGHTTVDVLTIDVILLANQSLAERQLHKEQYLPTRLVLNDKVRASPCLPNAKEDDTARQIVPHPSQTSLLSFLAPKSLVSLAV